MANINTEMVKSLIEKHELCLEILEAINVFEIRISVTRESIKDFANLFPDLHKKYLNDIDTMNRCIERLFERYNRVSNN